MTTKPLSSSVRPTLELQLFATSASTELGDALRIARAFGELLLHSPGRLAIGAGRARVEQMLSTAAQMQTLLNDLHASAAARPSLTLMR